MTDEMERVVTSGKKAFEGKTGGKTPSPSYESKISEGCNDPFPTTMSSLKTKNGRKSNG